MIVHIAGLACDVSPQRRQRCAWCGAILVDVDLTRVATVLADDEIWDGPATWECGSLVMHDGNVWSTVEHQDGALLPEACCARLPPEMTV